MGLSNDLMSQFAKATVNKTKETESTVYGVVKEYEGKRYVMLDGSDRLIPLPASSAAVMPDDRVSIKIKNHTTTITGNMSSPAARIGDVEEIDGKYAVYIPKIEADHAVIENLEATYAKITELDAINGRFETIEAYEADIEKLKSDYAEIKEFSANHATINDLDVVKADIADLNADVGKIDTLMFGSATGDVVHSDFANMLVTQINQALIDSAMIKSVNADTINGGTINANKVSIASDDGRLVLEREQIKIHDESGKLRVLIGDTNIDEDDGDEGDGDKDRYCICIWDSDGNPIFDATGITEYAVRDDLIKTNMVADAAISAGKIDMESLFSSINDGTRTIKSSRIYYDDKNQTLDVAFKELSDDVSSNGSWIAMNKESIESRVWEQYADKVTGDLRSDYSELKQTTEGFQSEVRSTYATKEELENIDVDFDIGGRNLLIDTNTAKSVEEHIELWNPDGMPIDISYRNSETDIVTEYTGIVDITAGSVSSLFVFYKDTFNTWLEPDTDYVVSFDMAFTGFYIGNSEDGMLHLQIGVGNRRSLNMQAPYTEASGIDPYNPEWQRVICKLRTADIPSNTSLTDQSLCIRFGEDAYVDVISIKNLKLEEGNKPTAWTPAPEDSASKGDIESVRDEFAETYVTKEGIGAIVGETFATKGEVESKIGEMALTKDNFAVTIGDTYTTKDDVQAEIGKLALTKDNFKVTLDSAYTTKEDFTELALTKDNFTITLGDVYATKDDLDNIDVDVDLEVGGRNYMIGTSEEKKTYTFYGWQQYLASVHQKDMPFTVSSDIKPKLVPGQKVTLSAYIENTAGTENVGLMFMPYIDDDANSYRQYTSFQKSDSIKGSYVAPGESGLAYVTVTLDVGNVASVAVALRHKTDTITSSTVNVRSVKLELGDVATDWTPAPEDMPSKTDVSKAATTATNYLKMSDDGLSVGNFENDKLGQNVRIRSDGVDIRKDGQTILAKFDEDLIELGKYSETASINMLGGAFKIAYKTEIDDGGFGVYGKTKAGYERLAFQPINENGNLTLGFGGYAAAMNNTGSGDRESFGKSGTNIWGNSIWLRAADNIHIMPKYNKGTSDAWEKYVYVYSHLQLSNTYHLYGTRKDNSTKASIAVLDGDDNTIFGYGSRDQKFGNVYYYGNNIIMKSNTDVSTTATAGDVTITATSYTKTVDGEQQTLGGNINLNGTIPTATMTTAKAYRIVGTGTNALNLCATSNDCLVQVYDNGSTKTLRSYANGGTYLGTSGVRWGQVWSSVAPNTTSDRNVKYDIDQFDDRYEALFKKLQPCVYKFIDGTSGRTHSGFISQDVEDALSEVGLTALDFAAFCKDAKVKEIEDPETGEVTTVDVLDEDGNPEYSYSLRYEEFIALNTHMIQKLQSENRELKDKVSSLEERLSRLEALIESA